ncbi:MAG: phytanoyl-CoA dioxygenase family protein [Alphaproteobacteria bacterium]
MLNFFKKKVKEAQIQRLNFETIKKKNIDVSSLFSSYWGQQNHPKVRTLRLREKNIVANLLSSAVKSEFDYFNNLNPQLLEKMVLDGYVEIPNLFGADDANKVRENFEDIDDCVAHHVWAPDKQQMKVSRSLNNTQGAFHGNHVVNNQTLMNVFLNENVLDLLEGYLGAPARLFHLNTMCSFASKKLGGAQQYHRDNSHPAFCVLFAYLNEVGLKNGPQEIYKSTHNIESFSKVYSDLDSNLFFDLENDSYGFDDLLESNLNKNKVVITGASGTCFLSDPRGIHRGVPVEAGRRWLAWARYALIPDDRAIPKFEVDPEYMRGLSHRQLYTISSIVEN